MSINNPCIVGSNRPWNRKMIRSLEEKTHREFVGVFEKDKLTLELCEKIKPQYIFLPHWSYLIPKEIFTSFDCVVFHMTDLPFGRGGSPLQNLIASGVQETKISALRCSEELDAGDIYLKKPLSLYGSAEEIFIRASDIIEEMIIEILDTNSQPTPQTGKVTVFKRRTPSQSNLEGITSLNQLFDMIRMLDAEGYPHAFIEVGSLRLEFTRASLKTDSVIADVKITLIK
jgi:methionyl-tRNA formyltransferase